MWGLAGGGGRRREHADIKLGWGVRLGVVMTLTLSCGAVVTGVGGVWSVEEVDSKCHGGLVWARCGLKGVAAKEWCGGDW